MLAAKVYRYDISAESDPTVFARILDVISVRNHVPKLACARLIDDLLCIDVEIDTLGERECSFIEKKILAIPTVISVQISS